MPKITTAIAPRVHEIIRDRVAYIIADEYGYQTNITYDLPQMPVYTHRYKPVMPDELPIAVVTNSTGNFDNQTVIKSDGTFTISIDVYQNGVSSDDQGGDEVASIAAHRIAGVVMGILEDPIYKILDFDPGFIMSSHVTSFESGEIDRQDSTSINAVRITLTVKAVQSEKTQNAIPIAGNDTTVMMGESEKGYFYQFNSI